MDELLLFKSVTLEQVDNLLKASFWIMQVQQRFFYPAGLDMSKKCKEQIKILWLHV